MSSEKTLFSETGGFILEARDEKVPAITKTFDKYNIPVNQIGRTGGEKIQINNVIDLLVADAKRNWETGLRNKL